MEASDGPDEKDDPTPGEEPETEVIEPETDVIEPEREAVEPEKPGRPTGAPHRKLAITLLVLSGFVGFFAMFAVWAKRQALETDTWVTTSGKLLDNSEVRSALSTYLVDQLYDNVDVESELKSQLPKDIQDLAGPASGALRELAGKAALEALSSSRVQDLWEDANRVAHDNLLLIVDNKGNRVSTDDGNVVLHLQPIVQDLGDRVGIDVADKIPASAAELTILKSDELGAAQDGVRILRTLAWALTALSFLLAGLAVYFARGWRREAVRGFGWVLIGLGIIVLAVRSVAGNVVADQLASTSDIEPAVRASWGIATSLLQASALAVILYGIFIVVGAWLAAPGRAATATRREIAPLLEARLIGYSVFVAFIILLLWWHPTETFGRFWPMVLLIGLGIAGFEVLRSQAMREFPDATWELGTERWKGHASAAWSRAGDIASDVGSGDSAKGVGEVQVTMPMRLKQIEKLASMRDSGVLTEEEFAEQKEIILAPDWKG